MSKVSVAEAKAKFAEILDRAAAGEEIIVTRSGKPVARLMPLAESEPRPFGLCKDWPEVGDEIFEPMSEEDLAWAEGKYNDEFGVTLPQYVTTPDKPKKP